MQHPDPQSATDLKWMRRALALAENGTALCSPNPIVGCVILDKNGELAGEGWHEYDRRDHAEIVALRAAGPRARNGTAYVTLEPCNHTGRTGPCSEALIANGLARVVAATADPNPLTAGHGLERMRQAGIAVSTGLCQPEAQRLNEGFARWITTRKPFIHMKIAMSADGKIAPATQEPGKPHWITGEASRAQVQQLRHAADAILTGINTILADDPLLTDRSGQPRRRPLLRVILDSQLRIPRESKLVQTAKNDVLVFTVAQNYARICELESCGVRVEVLPADAGRVPLEAVLETLGKENILTLLTETGSHLNTAFMAQGLVDRLTIFRSPHAMAPDATPAFAEGFTPQLPAAAETSQYGEDSGTSWLLHNPWQAQG